VRISSRSTSTMYWMTIGLLFALGLGLCCAQEKIECNSIASEEKLDQIGLEMSHYWHPETDHPLNAEDLASLCGKTRKSLKWVQSFMEKCHKGTLNHDISLISSKDIENSLTKYCDSPKLSKLLLSWSECGNKAKNHTVKCFNNYTLDLERMAKSQIPDADKIPLICCTYHRYDRCTEESFEKPGPDICPPKTVKGLHSLLTEVFAGSLDHLCGEFKADNDKCDSLNKRYNFLADVKIGKPRKTPFLAFIEVVSNLPKIEAKNSTASAEGPVV